MILFVDCEASSLSPASYPIEVGWVDEAGRGGCCLVRPAPGWTDWDPAAERLHGISRGMLRAEGLPVAEAARRFMDAAGADGAAPASDNPAWDGFWLGRLLRAAGLTERLPLLADLGALHLRACHPLLGLLAPPDSPERPASERRVRAAAERAITAAQAAHGHLHRHRALPDAECMRRTWLGVREGVARELARHGRDGAGQSSATWSAT